MLINGVHLLPDPSGALYWPAERLLVCADLLPDSKAIQALAGLVNRHLPRRVLVLGDHCELSLNERDMRLLVKAAQGRDWLWVGQRPAALDHGEMPGEWAADTVIGSLAFRPLPCSTPPSRGTGDGEISGGLRPFAIAALPGGEITAPCFAADSRRVILPGFFDHRPGTVLRRNRTLWGVNVVDPAVARLFRSSLRAFLMVRGKIVSQPRGKLLASPTSAPPA